MARFALQLAPMVLGAALYARRCRTLAARGRPVARRHQAWFALGIVLLLLALVSPIDTIGEERLFWVHMAQHLLLGDLAPLAIVLGLSGPVLRPLLASPVIQRLRVLAHPLVALPLWVANLYAWHLPVLYQAALAHDAVHALEHMLFFTLGAFMWAAAVEPLPGPAWFGAAWKAAYTLAVRTFAALLSYVFIFSGQILYPRYAAGERLSGVSPHTDQTIGGALMFVEGSVVTLVAFVWLFQRWTREAELRQTLIEGGADEIAATRRARWATR